MLSSAWFDALWMREGIEVPTMVESDACLERTVRFVLSPESEFDEGIKGGPPRKKHDD